MGSIFVVQDVTLDEICKMGRVAGIESGYSLQKDANKFGGLILSAIELNGYASPESRFTRDKFSFKAEFYAAEKNVWDESGYDEECPQNLLKNHRKELEDSKWRVGGHERYCGWLGGEEELQSKDACQ